MTVFFQNCESILRRMECHVEVLLTTKVKKIKRTVLSTNVAELQSLMKCCGSFQFLRGLWMDMSGEVEEIHMTTDTKNLVTTARTIYLSERMETILMISLLRKEACSGSIRDLAHIPTQHCLADCLTKSSAKADNLNTSVKTRRLSDVDIHQILEHLLEHKASLSNGCRTFMHTGRNMFFLERLKDFSLTSFAVRTIPCDVCENFHGF